jgi:phospholipid/cholesterol/gamma-HCH transport system ATP-binding protein
VLSALVTLHSNLALCHLRQGRPGPALESADRALALDPELLFLDEPTAGLDPIGAAAFDALIRQLSQDLGLTVFMITHDLDSLYAITDKVAVVADRHIVAKATVEELERSDHPWIREYFLGPRGRAAGRAA